MQNKLQHYFPMIRTEEELLNEINNNPKLVSLWNEWSGKHQEEFLHFCTGMCGVKILYDTFFKEIMDPYTVPERLNDFLSILLKQKVRVVQVLPVESRLGNESSLLTMDIVIECEDGTLVNVEVQKSDTGLTLKLLQKYMFVPLDIFKKILHTNGIQSKSDAWLAFLCCDDPDTIIQIITAYPEFKPLYEHVYDICLNVEKVMGMFSKELAELDKNTVDYMIDDMQRQIDEFKEDKIKSDKIIEQLTELVTQLTTQNQELLQRLDKKE